MITMAAQQEEGFDEEIYKPRSKSKSRKHQLESGGSTSQKRNSKASASRQKIGNNVGGVLNTI